jgi:aminopeptidase N
VDDCVENSVTLFRQWMEEKDPDTDNAIPIDLRSVVYCNAMREGKEREWNFLWARYKKSNVGSEKTMIIGALGCSKEIWLLNR